MGSYEWHKDGIWYITSSQKNGRSYIATASAGTQAALPFLHFDRFLLIDIVSFSCSADGTAHICDVSKLDFNANLSPMLTYTGHQSSVNCVKFHHNNDLMLTASGDGTAQIWRFNPEQVTTAKTCLFNSVNLYALSPAARL